MAKKGLNMEKIVEIRSEVEEVMEVENTSSVVVNEVQDKIEEMGMNEMNELKNKIDNGIKYAIASGKGAEEVAKYISGKQILGIFKSYKEIVGVDMSDVQKNYLKTLNSKQLSNILHTLNVARREFATA